jgi:HSP20 family molecular chaperone IbpA
VQKTQRRGLFVFKPRSFYRENEKEFVVGFRVPKKLALEDIKIKFNKNVLVINIEKSQTTDGSYSYDSFTQTFTTPETKADIKDIKTTIENGKVSVIVPIM